MDKEHPSLTCGFLDLRHAFHHALGREHLHKVLLLSASRRWRYRCSDSPKPFYDTLGDLTPKLVSLASRVQP